MTGSLPLPPGPFSCIVADPPWTYTFETRKTEVAGTGWDNSAQRHYSTMTMQQIKDLPVQALAADDAILWLWVVNPMLTRCIEVCEAWGFSYRGLLTWAKSQPGSAITPANGTGYWLRGATEHAVLAVRGKPARLNANVPTWFSAPRGRHSAKPQRAFEIFEKYSAGPRLEMFARRARPGWTTWGNESAADPDDLSLFGGAA